MTEEKIRLDGLNNEDFEIHPIRYERKDEQLIIYFSSPLEVSIGDLLYIERPIEEETINSFFIKRDTLEILETSEDKTIIYVKYPGREWSYVKEVIFPDEEKSSSFFTIKLDQPCGIYQYDIWEEDGISPEDVKNPIPSKNFGFYANFEEGNRGPINGVCVYDEYLHTCHSLGAILNDDAIDVNSFLCHRDSFDTDVIKGTPILFTGSPYFYEKKEDEKIICIPFNKFKIKIVKNYFTYPVELKHNNLIGLNQEDLLTSYFITNIKNKVVPDIIDMEKVCFEPFVETENGIIPVRRIQINPFFRVRDMEGWNTNDGRLWNYEFDSEKGNLPVSLNGDRVTLDLGYKLDDIIYQKNVLKQSFLRLSLYDREIPTEQQLLSYSTVFTDTGRLYREYVTEKNNLSGDRRILFSDETFAIEEKLRMNFEITDRYDTTRSSEGFYFYLFPSLIEELKRTYGKQTIYMKIEFNHAGFGKTVPFVWMRNNFPRENYLKDGNIDMESYYSDLYIPAKIDYIEEYKKYGIIFPKETLVPGGNTLLFNIFEPKINPSGIIQQSI